MTRIDRLRDVLEEPLLVTNLVNVRYLTGFDSSNAALLVEPGGKATLYTDFRYLEAARAPYFFEKDKGRCAIVSLASGNNSYEWAGLPKAEIPGRSDIGDVRIIQNAAPSADTAGNTKRTATVAITKPAMPRLTNA